jgi:hypothetical protein
MAAHLIQVRPQEEGVLRVEQDMSEGGMLLVKSADPKTEDTGEFLLGDNTARETDLKDERGWGLTRLR